MKFTTPKGNLKWAFISGDGRDGKYSIVVKVPEEQAKAKMAIIDQFWKDNKPQQAKKPRPRTTGYKYEEDDETGERTGYVLFSLSTNSTWPSGDKVEIGIFTAKKPVKKLDLGNKKIGEESLGFGVGTLSIYEYEGQYGTTLYLSGVQLSTFVEYTGGGIDEADLEADEDAEDIDLGIDLPEAQDEEEPAENPIV